MRILQSLMIATSVITLTAPACAGNSARAWGTGGGSDNAPPSQQAASFNQSEAQTAQQATIGRDIINIGRSVISCGVCTYYTVTGNQNSILGNSSSGLNSGQVFSNGQFQ